MVSYEDWAEDEIDEATETAPPVYPDEQQDHPGYDTDGEYEQDPSDGSLARGTIAGGLGNVDDTEEEQEQAIEDTETVIRDYGGDPAEQTAENTDPEAIQNAVEQAAQNASESLLPWWVKFVPVLIGLLLFLYLIRPLLTIGANTTG